VTRPGAGVLRRLIGWIVGLPLAVVVIAFAIANRGPVAVSLDPLPFVVEAPLFAVVFAGVVVGMAIGATLAWLGGFKRGRRGRDKGGNVASPSSGAPIGPPSRVG